MEGEGMQAIGWAGPPGGRAGDGEPAEGNPAGGERGNRGGPSRLPRVGIVGTGLVGSTIAYTLLVRGPHCELVLVDVNRAKAEGDAMDLNHGIPLAAPMPIRAGEYGELRDADVVVIAAGVAQRPGETRLALLRRNAQVIRDVVERVIAVAPGAVLLVVTNPVDVLSYIAYRHSGLPAARVVGSGTLLDTLRLRYLLGQRFGVDPRSVHAYIIGEHGDSEIAVWSLANIAGVRLSELGGARDGTLSRDLEAVLEQVRTAAYAIIERKGATYYAVALAVARILESILYDQRSVLTVSTLVNGPYGIDDVYLGLPCVVGRRGVERIIELPLAPEELAALRRSADILRQAAREVMAPAAGG